MKLLTSSDSDHNSTADSSTLVVSNTTDVQTLSLDGVTRIHLVFPKFTDGRAFSQAVALRRRLGFKGEIRATGDVLVDQLLPMQRCGFSEAVLRADQDPAVGAQLLQHYQGFYQGDAQQAQPHFAATV